MCFTNVWSFVEISVTVIKLKSGHDFVTDRQTDPQTHRHTDARGKTICLPTLAGGRHNKSNQISKLQLRFISLSLVYSLVSNSYKSGVQKFRTQNRSGQPSDEVPPPNNNKKKNVVAKTNDIVIYASRYITTFPELSKVFFHFIFEEKPKWTAQLRTVLTFLISIFFIFVLFPGMHRLR